MCDYLNIKQLKRIMNVPEAAQIATHILSESIQKRGKAVLGIGETKMLEDFFMHLSQQSLAWKQIHIFLTDERCVSLNSLESNYRNLPKSLLVKIPQENIHIFEYNEAHAVKPLLKYQAALDALGGFDLVIMIANKDGHIAALYPKHTSIQKENVGFFYTDAPEHPRKRMTASKKLLLKARAGMLFVNSSTEKMLDDPAKTVIECPLKLITQLPQHYIFKEQ